jgi:NADH dehydrogenase FAD-containing subunit
LTRVTAILAEGVEVEFGGRKEILAANTIVLAAGTQPNDKLEAALRAMSVEFYKIGDCAKPRKAIDAIHEGFQVAFNL